MMFRNSANQLHCELRFMTTKKRKRKKKKRKPNAGITTGLREHAQVAQRTRVTIKSAPPQRAFLLGDFLVRLEGKCAGERGWMGQKGLCPTRGIISLAGWPLLSLWWGFGDGALTSTGSNSTNLRFRRVPPTVECVQIIGCNI